jgi:ribosomal protein S12 methylthiotransferase accessory factor
MRSGIRLNHNYKGYIEELDKFVAPLTTIQKVREALQKKHHDILERTLRIDTGRLGIPVYMSLCGAEALRSIGTTKQMGKGCTPEQAEASALMELVERYSFFRFMKQRHFIETHYSCIREEALDFKYIPLSVYDPDPQDQRNRLCFEELPMRWAWALDIAHEKEVLIPIDWFYLIHEYNGSAAGNSIEEAILQGLCEVVERHVSSVITHQRMETPTINPKTIRNPAAQDLLKKFETNGIEVYLKDFSLNTGIPTVGTLAYDPSTFPDSSEIVFTAGTSTDPEKSVIRALTEVAQLAGEFQHKTTYRPTLPKFTRLEETWYLTSPSNVVDVSTLPNLSNPDFLQEIQSCISTLKNIGLDVSAVDVTHPEIGIPAVYVIIPGAHFMERTRENSVSYHSARLASQLSDPNQAVLEMERIARLFPERYEVRFFLGYAYERKGMPEIALSHFETALKMEPRPIDVANIYCHIGVAYRDQGLFEKAIEMFKVAEKHDNILKEVHQQLGFCYFKIGKYEEAIRQFEKAIEIDPGSAIDYANIAANFKAMGYLQMAIPIYEMALEINPELEFARTQLHQIRMSQGQRESV